jgi:hypothetical protein
VDIEGPRLLVNVAFKKFRDLPLIDSIEKHNSL